MAARREVATVADALSMHLALISCFSMSWRSVEQQHKEQENIGGCSKTCPDLSPRAQALHKSG